MAVRKVNNNINIISENLRKFREKQNLSQAELVAKLNLLGIPIHKNDISLIENNKRTVKDYEVWGIIRVLDIKFEELFYDVEKKLDY